MRSTISDTSERSACVKYFTNFSCFRTDDTWIAYVIVENEEQYYRTGPPCHGKYFQFNFVFSSLNCRRPFPSLRPWFVLFSSSPPLKKNVQVGPQLSITKRPEIPVGRGALFWAHSNCFPKSGSQPFCTRIASSFTWRQFEHAVQCVFELPVFRKCRYP